jgi:hypothetical protein
MSKLNWEKANKVYQAAEKLDVRQFSKFMFENMSLTELYNAETIENNPPQADAYICGSDQIWAGDDAFYLSFAPSNALKIAYAPSFGGMTTFPKEKELRMRELIGKLDKVGMREQSGVDVCRRLGIASAVKVVDPTLLLNKEDYQKISITATINKPYAFVYLLGNPIDISISEISKYVKSKGLEMVYVASQQRIDKHPKIEPTINEWLGYISNADLVITNSFHCVVFSLIFHRRFISIPLSDGCRRMNTRIEEILNETHLKQCIAYGDLNNIDLDKIDFKKFEEYKERQQSYSKQFLGL